MPQIKIVHVQINFRVLDNWVIYKSEIDIALKIKSDMN